MNIEIIIDIVQVIASPLIAAVVAVWIGEILRKRNFQKDSRLKVLRNLIAYRHKVDSDKFLSALNSIVLFYKDYRLRTMIFELKKSFNARDKGIIGENESNVLIARIIKRICELENFSHISIDEIDNLFKKK